MSRRLLLSLLALTAIVTAAPAGSARAGEPSTTGGPVESPTATTETSATNASTTLQSCVRQRHRLSVAVLMDVSSSLAETDPTNQRVNGLHAALAGLESLAEGAHGQSKPTVEVLLLGFYGAVTPKARERQWVKVSPHSREQLQGTAGEYAAKNTGYDTDFGTALITAKDELAEHERRASEAHQQEGCRALLLFTDGGYEIRARGPNSHLPLELPYAPGVKLTSDAAGRQARAAGEQMLCKAGGLMDSMADEGVVRFTVGLTNSASTTVPDASKMSARQEGFLQALATGEGRGYGPCGQHLSTATGEYIPVSRSAELLFTFNRAFEGSTATPQQHAVCPGKPCTRGAIPFVIEPGITQFKLLADTGEPKGGVALDLTGPGGSTTLTPSVSGKSGETHERQLSGITLEYHWSTPSVVEVTGSVESGASTALGRWSAYFVSTASGGEAAIPTSTLELASSLTPVLTAPEHIYRGESNELKFKVVSAQPGAADGPLAKGAHLAASIAEPGGAPLPEALALVRDGNLGYTATLDEPFDAEATHAEITAKLDFRPVAGVPVRASVNGFTREVRLPPNDGFPSVLPTALTLPAVKGTGSTSGAIRLTGTGSAGGCAWVQGGGLHALGEGTEVHLDHETLPHGPGRCIHLAKGQSATVTLTYRVTGEGNGQVKARVKVHLYSNALNRETVVSVPVTFFTAIHTSVPARVGLTILITVVGIALPLAMLYLLNLFRARFGSPKAMWRARVRVAFSDGSLVRLGEDGSPGREPLTLTKGEFSHVSDDDTEWHRTLQIEDWDFRAVAGMSWQDKRLALLSGPYGAVESHGRTVLSGPRCDGQALRGGTAHVVPLELIDTWVFSVDTIAQARNHGDADDLLLDDDAGGPVVYGDLLVVTRAIPTPSEIDDLVKEAGSALSRQHWATPAPPQRDAGGPPPEDAPTPAPTVSREDSEETGGFHLDLE